ncbi:MAG: hypothetical protein ACI9FD_001806, partial [Gammaproteobacteria bacterium]
TYISGGPMTVGIVSVRAASRLCTGLSFNTRFSFVGFRLAKDD